MKTNNLQAVLWDMDGVVADTAEQHFQSWIFAFGKRGVPFSASDFKAVFGQRNDTIIRKIIAPDVDPAMIEAVARDKEEFFRAAVAHEVRPFPGVVALLRSLKESGIPSAIASSAPLENIHAVLGGLGIEAYFKALVYGLEVKEGKPKPDVFLLAARKVGAEPGHCVVMEDAVAGVKAAKAAGMRCVAITNSHPAASLAEADLVVDTLEKVDIERLESLFGGKELKVERTLILVKPDAIERNLGGAVLSRLEAAGLKIVALKALRVDEPLAHKHYAVHAGKAFFKDLIDYITSYPIIAAVFEGQDAVAVARKAMGATDPKKAEPGTIRRDLGIDLQRNSVHGSDSPENAKIEIGLFFKPSEFIER